MALFGGRSAPNVQAAIGTLPAGMLHTGGDFTMGGGAPDPNADLLAAIRQGLGLGPMNPAGQPLSSILGDNGAPDPSYQQSEAQTAARNQLMSQGVGTAVSLAGELADLGVPGIGFLASSLMNSFMAPGLSHESREANEIQGYQNFMGGQSQDFNSVETPTQLLNLLRQLGSPGTPYAQGLNIGNLNLESPDTTWEQIRDATVKGGQVTGNAQLGVRPGRISGTSNDFANDIEAKILQLVGASLPGTQGDPYRQQLDKAAAPRSFYYQDTAGLPTWANGQYTNQYLFDPNAKPFTGAYGNTYSLSDFPVFADQAQANQKRQEEQAMIALLSSMPGGA